MSEPLKLAPKPKATEKSKQAIIEMLEKALVVARRGDIGFLLMLHNDTLGDWMHHESGSVKISSLVGQIEITKQELIQEYLSDDDNLVPK